MIARSKRRIHLTHHYYSRKGLYTFLRKNIFKLILSILVFVGLVYLAKWLLPDLTTLGSEWIAQFSNLSIYIFFTISESFLLGLIPPDLFIMWTENEPHPYAAVLLLGTLSYIGGVISYGIGNKIGHFKKVEAFLQRKFANHITQINKWGAILIVLAALFPLPFSPVSMTAGLLRYPFKSFALVGLTRISRFLIYAFVLFRLF